jgi:hypothetical protein
MFIIVIEIDVYGCYEKTWFSKTGPWMGFTKGVLNLKMRNRV